MLFKTGNWHLVLCYQITFDKANYHREISAFNSLTEETCQMPWTINCYQQWSEKDERRLMKIINIQSSRTYIDYPRRAYRMWVRWNNEKGWSYRVGERNFTCPVLCCLSINYKCILYVYYSLTSVSSSLCICLLVDKI